MTRPSAAAIDAVAALHRERVADGSAPSSVWGVFDRGGLVASGGAGDRGDGTAPDADTVYRIASCTKSVTATTLLGLAAEGLLSLDAPITDFVPAFRAVRLPTADSPVPTVRMLLTMSAGFPTDDPWADRQESISDDELDDVLRAGLLFDSVPGTRFAYSNLGYALLGRVVAVAAGAPFTTVATDRVLRPLGLDDTVFAAEDSHGHVVTGYRRHGEVWEALSTPGPGAFSPIGGLFSTVRDLAAWAGWLAAAFDGTTPPFAAGRAATGAAPLDGPAAGPLSTADRRALQQAMRMIPAESLPGSSRATGYGFGLFVEHDPVVGSIVSHSGGYPGFSAHMRWSVSTGIGVVAFENATQAKVSAAATRAHDLVLRDVLSARPVPASPAPASPAPASPVLAGPVLPETRAAQAAVTSLLADWDDDRAAAICAPNVPMDVPWDRRRAAVHAAVAAVGADLGAAAVAEESSTPTHLRWWLPGAHGRLRVEIRLAPLAAGLVQTLTVRAEPTPV
jgi:CubicO group peptidase (beta-lactamase class C family)